ncbi:MAG TPA: chemotaxis protein CheB [Candidatus Polarisedimenticolaceae bacterium]|nr:chemotaxis protein CheB [Candidatus Polarisedimenticolaceae bacterium]
MARTPALDPGPQSAAFPIVGIGASAGGLEAFTQLLKALPENTGMAFVIVQHLDPDHPSLLPELLARVTSMPVIQVTDGVSVEANRCYVMPPNADMALERRKLYLAPRERGQHMPIDTFLRSLAGDQQTQAIGVILSGTASDGVVGLRAIKSEGGITFAQAEQSAKFGSMPHAAISAGVVDFILPPEGIAEELARIGQDPYVRVQPAELAKALTEPVSEPITRIFGVLREAAGVDFSQYKPNTILRRIKRRMLVRRIEELDRYADYVESTPIEAQTLYEDILINVTGFFRDPLAYDALRRTVFPAILERRLRQNPVRVWVPGCSTGEEAYSIAICLLEYLGDNAAEIPIQIFATDISEIAIDTARAGIYRESIAHDVSPERLRRFFGATERGYMIHRSVRDMCVFARQNVTTDPPFSRLDLISCRNVLIYLGQSLQRQVMPIFHYALKPTGFLLLGTSETIGVFGDLFEAVDRKQRIYSKKFVSSRVSVDFGPPETPPRVDRPPSRPEPPSSLLDIQREADRAALARYAPAGALINGDMEILQFRGQTGRFLEPAPGQASLNLMRMAKEGLAADLRAAIQSARQHGEPVRKEGLQVRHDGKPVDLALEVVPLRVREGNQHYFIVLFEEVAERKPKPKLDRSSQRRAATENEAARLERELAATKDYLQSIIEEQESTNEELRSANEEILSSNEELQSTNEELETSKEELQSTNEELTTVNEELQNSNVEMSQANNDLVNVLASVSLPMVIVGADLRIRRFNVAAERVLHLVSSDTGRRFTDIKTALDIADLPELLLSTMDRMTLHERAVQDREGRWYALRVRPYRTPDNRIEGAVILLVDIDDLKRSAEELRESRDYAEGIVDTMRDGLLVLDAELRVQRANRSFYEMFQLARADVEMRPLTEIADGRLNVGSLLDALRDVLASPRRLEDLELVVTPPGDVERTLSINGRRLDQGPAHPPAITLTLADITKRKQAEQAVAELSGRLLKTRDQEERRLARELHDSTAQSLSALTMSLSVVHQTADELPEEGRKALSDGMALADQCAREVRDIASLLHPPLLDEVGLRSALEWYAELFARRTGLRVELDVAPDLGRHSQEIETAVYRIVQECLTNVHRHSGSPSASVRVDRQDHALIIEVADVGRGLPPGPMPTHTVGIAGMRERVRQYGGTLEITGNRPGTQVRAVLPTARSRP